MNVFNIERAFKQAKEKKYPFVFWLVDLHDVIIEGKYNRMNEGREFFPDAALVLRWITRRKDQRLILWSSSHKDALDDIVKWLRLNHIEVDYVNENPEVANSNLCDFSKKPYFQILLDDKAGFEGATDWTLIKEELKRIGEW
jgi:hypothetical protein